MSTVEVATTLWDLRVAGQEIQDMGGAHTSAAAVIDHVDVAAANDRPAQIGIGATGFSSAYKTAASAVHRMLTSNAASLNDSGRALIWCADQNYARADDDVKSYFDSLNRADTDHD
ncbi:hypothetical protein [Nocardioides sp. GXZ039]|uniref:hypothetical protein n=1 Tax=Nocardioides sp. GXZ039 TaxID=3136018 RepID=UPI0030F4826F